MRDEFTKQTLDILAKRVGVRCSNPGCRKLTTGPQIDTKRIVNIGVGAHITAAKSGGPRFNPSLSPVERKSPQNGIWLCQNCAKLIDNDPNRYTGEMLQEWKQKAETAALCEVERSSISRTQKTVKIDYSVNIEISYREDKILSERHDYRLEIKLQNLGNQPIISYNVDLEFPARVIENPEKNLFYVEARSNDTMSFFRVIHKTDSDTIYPGDTIIVMDIPYYIDNEIYFNRGNLLKQSVKATLYRTGFLPIVIEKQFDELQCF